MREARDEVICESTQEITDLTYEYRVLDRVLIETCPVYMKMLDGGIDTGYAHTKDNRHDSIKFSLLFIVNYRVHIYRIPGIDGFIAHILANKPVDEEPGGPGAMFLALQKIDIGETLLSTVLCSSPSPLSGRTSVLGKPAIRERSIGWWEVWRTNAPVRVPEQYRRL